VPEATKFCPQCGNELAAASVFCPHCGTRQPQLTEVQHEVQQAEAQHTVVYRAEPEPAGPSGFQRTMDSILATTQTHKWWWVGGAGGLVAVALIAIVVFGGFLGPSGKAICTATLKQAQDFGVLSPGATLASSSAKSTNVEGRRSCTAQSGDDTYTLQVDVKNEDTEHKKCKDFDKQSDCLKLYSVARTDGMTTYQVREIPPDQTDEAILAGEGQNAPAPPAGSNSGASESSGFEAPTSVDNGTGTQSEPSQAAPDQGTPDQAPPSNDQPQQ
jgi:hypothetical protein